jgi:predicted flap endonuclease-1-like 5' DNA nuclease
VRVTGYAIAEIIWWLLVGVTIGVAVGWLLRKWFAGRRLEDGYAGIRAEEENRRSELQRELDEYKSQAAGLSSDLDLRNADLERLQAKIADHETAAAEAEAKLKAARAAIRKSEAKIEDRESTITSLRGQVDKTNSKLVELESSYAGAEGTMASLRADMEAKDNEVARLIDRADEMQARIAELESGAIGTAEATARVAELESLLTTAVAERDSGAARLGTIETRLAECTDRREADAATISALEAQLAASAAPGELPEKDAAVAKVAEIAARTRGAGPMVDDDLKMIHGVGPKLEGLLKSMDITSFRQVANFTTEDIQYVTAALDAFPGRIERDDWISSAAEEHSKKYNEPA